MVKIINTRIMKLLLISMLMLFNSNCENLSFKKDDELSLKRVDYTGNQLRIDGYYYLINYNDPQKNMGVFIFFRNGVLTYLGGGFLSFNELENYIINKDFIDKKKDVKYFWGVFQVKNDIIKFERWYPSEGAKEAYVREGKILNDTTFHITKSYRSNGTELSDENETYHFRKFSPKPDSTNVFVK